MLEISKTHYRLSKTVLYAFVVILLSVIIQEFIELYGLKEHKRFTKMLDVVSDLESVTQRTSFLTYHYSNSTLEQKLVDERKVIFNQIKDIKEKTKILTVLIEENKKSLSPGAIEIIESEPFSLRFVLVQFAKIEDKIFASYNTDAPDINEELPYLLAYSGNVYRGLRALRERLSYEANSIYEKTTNLKQVLIIFDIVSIMLMAFFVIYFIINRLKEEQFSRRYAEIKLTDQIQELETFTATIAHDLKSPLHNIYLHGNILLDTKEVQDPNNEKLRSGIQTMVTQSEKLSHMIRSLLKFFKNSSKKVDKKRVSLNDLVESAKGLIEQDIVKYNGAVECIKDIRLYVDEDLFVNVFQNLIQNALRYSDVVNPSIKISAKSLGAYAFVIEVEDNGKGIDDSEKEFIFKPFKRGKAEKDSEGMGMGLSTVEKIVKWHGGRIEVKNKVDGGALFIITIPNLK